MQTCAPANPKAQKPQLLVVDDDFEMTNVLKELLRDCDYEVDVAYDGIQALGKIKSKSYDAVVCDYQMPRMNGQALYETLMKSHPHMAARFIFVTGFAHNAEVTRFFQASHVPHLAKPFRSAEVVHTVQRLLHSVKN